MPPAPLSLPILTATQRQSAFQSPGSAGECVIARPYHGARSARAVDEPRDNVSDSYYYVDVPQTQPPSGLALAGIIIASIIGTAALCTLVYFCWKFLRPRPTYYETAMIHDRRKRSRRSKRSSCLSYPDIQNDRLWPDDGFVLDELARPNAAGISSRHGTKNVNDVEAAWRDRT